MLALRLLYVRMILMTKDFLRKIVDARKRPPAWRDVSQMREDPRVVMLGFDALSLPFLQAHLDELPTFKGLFAKGALIEPETTGNHFPASCWPTFASGKGVGEHGQYFPFQWDPKNLKHRRIADPAWQNELLFEPFWYPIARRGIDCTAFDVNFVLENESAPCRQISNWSIQDTDAAAASDPALLAELRRRFGRRPIGKEVPVVKTKSQSRKIRKSLIKAIRCKTDAILWLMERNAWRFFIATYYEAHRAGHNLWPVTGEFASEADPDALLDVLRTLDSEIARVIEHISDERTTVILFALHGMAPNRAQDHFLQEIMSRLNARYLSERGHQSVTAQRPSLMSILRKRVPPSWQYMIVSLVGENVQDWVVDRSLVGGLNWSRTPAFRMSSGGEGMVRLNIKGREARGFFEPNSNALGDYVAWLKERLLEIRVKGTGELLVKRILHPHEIFPGPRSHFLPDLLLEWAPEAPAEHIYSEHIGEINSRLQTGRGGNHAGGAFALVTGPGATRPDLGKVAHIKDIGKFATACLEHANAPELAPRRTGSSPDMLLASI
jgi:predicted AlkP superfamily phosphohydrolase/phosphomutase